MSYCQQLFEKLTEWQESIAEMGKAKDEYLKVFGDGKKKQYEEKKELALKAEWQFKKYKNEECFIEEQGVRFFGPDYETLKRIYEGLGLKLRGTFFNLTVINGRITKIFLSSLVADSHVSPEEITAAIFNVAYFSELAYLNCNECKLKSPPRLPEKLEELVLSKNNLNKLPNLSKTLKKLECDGNELEELPDLPPELDFLNCEQNGIGELLRLPASLVDLYCGANKLEKLPELPKTLKTLDCPNNGLTELPELPAGLEHLDVGINKISKLPELPKTLKTIRCFGNKLTELPDLPPGLMALYCDNNKITDIPDLPPALATLEIIGNNLTEEAKVKIWRHASKPGVHPPSFKF